MAKSPSLSNSLLKRKLSCSGSGRRESRNHGVYPSVAILILFRARAHFTLVFRGSVCSNFIILLSENREIQEKHREKEIDSSQFYNILGFSSASFPFSRFRSRFHCGYFFVFLNNFTILGQISNSGCIICCFISISRLEKH